MTHDFTSHERSVETKTRYQRQHEPFAPENACAHRQPDEQETSALCEHSQGCYTHTLLHVPHPQAWLHPAALSIRSCNTCPLKQIINFPTNL